MRLPATIKAARGELQESGWLAWHVNDIMRRDETQTKVLTRLIVSFGPCEIGNDSHGRLVWLAYFVARRVLPCWQIYCDTDEPQQAVKAIGDWLNKGIQAKNWDELSHVAEPSFQGARIYDCRVCDTSAAAEAVAWAVRLLLSGQALEACYAVSELVMPSVRQTVPSINPLLVATMSSASGFARSLCLLPMSSVR